MTCSEAILSNDVYDYITDFPIANLENLEPVICYENIDDQFHIVYLDRSAVPDLQQNLFEYQSVPKVYGLMQEAGSFDVNGLSDSGILQIQRSSLNLTGRGVVLCIIDTGIDYRNPVFLDANGGSRILSIWDQTIQTGTPPQGFLYGSEYSREEINQALSAQEPYSVVPSMDEDGHGTAMASLAAGSILRGAEAFIGAAPEADIVVVKLKPCKPYFRDYYLLPEDAIAYQENDIMQAVRYVDSFTELFRRPVVICLGIGTNMGNHTGSSALSRYLNTIAVKRSRAVVVCGGNEGNAAHHYRGNLLQPDETSSIIENTQTRNYQDVEVRVAEGARGFFLELWGSLPDAFNVTVISPGGESAPQVRLGLRQSITFRFIYESSAVTINSILVEPYTGEELILFRMIDPTPGIWTFRVEAVSALSNGIFHMWLPISQFLQAPVYFLRPSPYITLTEPAMTENVISVSTYQADNGSFYINSGRGFGKNGAIRPDLAAPGANVATISGNRSGSSFAAAITAGAVAQFMQWAVVEQNDQYADSREIKSYFIRGARREASRAYPNQEWGYGKMNMAGVFDVLRGI